MWKYTFSSLIISVLWRQLCLWLAVCCSLDDLLFTWERFCYIIFRVNYALQGMCITAQGSLPHAQGWFTPLHVFSPACARLHPPRIQLRQMVQSQHRIRATAVTAVVVWQKSLAALPTAKLGHNSPGVHAKHPKSQSSSQQLRNCSFASDEHRYMDGFEASPPSTCKLNTVFSWGGMCCMWPG